MDLLQNSIQHSLCFLGLFSDMHNVFWSKSRSGLYLDNTLWTTSGAQDEILTENKTALTVGIVKEALKSVYVIFSIIVDIQKQRKLGLHALNLIEFLECQFVSSSYSPVCFHKQQLQLTVTLVCRIHQQR